MSEPRARTPLENADYAAALVAGLIALALFAFPLYAWPYRALFADLGASLPFVVGAALTWLGPAIGASVLGVVAGALATLDRRPRRLAMVGAGIVGIVALVGCVVATVWPVWQMAGQIKAEASSEARRAQETATRTPAPTADPAEITTSPGAETVTR